MFFDAQRAIAYLDVQAHQAPYVADYQMTLEHEYVSGAQYPAHLIVHETQIFQVVNESKSEVEFTRSFRLRNPRIGEMSKAQMFPLYHVSANGTRYTDEQAGLKIAEEIEEDRDYVSRSVDYQFVIPPERSVTVREQETRLSTLGDFRTQVFQYPTKGVTINFTPAEGFFGDLRLFPVRSRPAFVQYDRDEKFFEPDSNRVTGVCRGWFLPGNNVLVFWHKLDWV